jgi:hypothetical protein
MSLSAVFSGYAHQDWKEEFGSLESMIDAFMKGESANEIEGIVTELKAISHHSEDQIQSILIDKGCFLGPEIEGKYSSTLSHVIDLLEKSWSQNSSNQPR